MGTLLQQFFSNPLLYVGGTLASIIAVLFLVVLWGIMVFLFSRENATERSLGNALALWGMVLIIFFFILWEAIRLIALHFT